MVFNFDCSLCRDCVSHPVCDVAFLYSLVGIGDYRSCIRKRRVDDSEESIDSGLSNVAVSMQLFFRFCSTKIALDWDVCISQTHQWADSGREKMASRAGVVITLL